MALKIRLRRQGRINRPFYRLVLADVRSPRDGKYIEELGWYNPFEAETEKCISVDPQRIEYWLGVGAELSDNARNLVAKVAPGVLKNHTQKVVAHRAKTSAKRKARRKAAA